MARALTADELTALRTDGQTCRLYLAVHVPTVVFTARVNGATSSDDRVAGVAFDGGSAGYANALPDMTVYVGSTAGAHDRGIARLRVTPTGTSGTLKIGETSDIDWTDDDYLTVVDEFALWPRHLRITSGGTVYMDYDEAYTDQHEDCDPVPVLGPAATVVWLTGSTVDVEFDASDSWVPGSTITAYSWTATGASATADMNTDAPTITYNAAGTYRVQCTVTADNGKTTTGYRYVFVYTTASPPATVFQLEQCSGSWGTGGWSFTITAWDDATLADIHDHALVALFARDVYAGTEASIGPVSGRENIIAVGWVAGDTITWDPEQGNVRFTVQGPQWWLDKMTGFPCGLEDYDGTPTAWTQMEDLTVDRGLWHFLHWRTTATVVMDVTLTGDDRELATFEAPVGSLWDQMLETTQKAILARPCCDRYGRLFAEIDTQYTPSASRGSIPVVMTLTEADWMDELVIERQSVPETGMVDVSGVAYSAGTATPLFSLAPGHVFGRYGGIYTQDYLALTDQTEANTLAGLILARMRNEYPVVRANLAANNRAFDICPLQHATLDVEEADTERGIDWTRHLIPRTISYRHDAEAGVLLASMECERETFEVGAIIGDPPPEPPSPPAPPSPPTPIDPGPTPVVTWDFVVVACGEQLGRTFNWTDASPDWEDITTGLPASSEVYALGMGPDGQAFAAVIASSYATSGIYHCSNVLAASVSWALVFDCATAYGQTYDGGAQYFKSLAVDDNSECWVVMSDRGYPNETIRYWHGTAATLSAGGATMGGAVPSKYQFAVCYDPVTECVYASGQGNYEAAGHVFNLTNGTKVKCTYGVNGSRGHQSVGGKYAIQANDWGGSGGIVDHIADVDTALFGGATASTRRPLHEGPDGGVFYIAGDYDLQKDGAEIITDANVFGASRVGAGFCLGQTEDDIMWVSASAAAPGEKRIAGTDDGGATWSAKDGDWESEVGAWPGSNDYPTAFIVHRGFE